MSIPSPVIPESAQRLSGTAASASQSKESA